MCTELNKSHLDIFQSSSPCSRLHPRVGGVFKMRKTKQEVEGKCPLRLTCPVCFVFFFFYWHCSKKAAQSTHERVVPTTIYRSGRRYRHELVVWRSGRWVSGFFGGWGRWSWPFSGGSDPAQMAVLYSPGTKYPFSTPSSPTRWRPLQWPERPGAESQSGGLWVCVRGELSNYHNSFFLFFYSLQSALFSCSFWHKMLLCNPSREFL